MVTARSMSVPISANWPDKGTCTKILMVALGTNEVGVRVGIGVGAAVGAVVGATLGATLGIAVGATVGRAVAAGAQPGTYPARTATKIQTTNLCRGNFDGTCIASSFRPVVIIIRGSAADTS